MLFEGPRPNAAAVGMDRWAGRACGAATAGRTLRSRVSRRGRIVLPVLSAASAYPALVGEVIPLASEAEVAQANCSGSSGEVPVLGRSQRAASSLIGPTTGCSGQTALAGGHSAASTLR